MHPLSKKYLNIISKLMKNLPELTKSIYLNPRIRKISQYRVTWINMSIENNIKLEQLQINIYSIFIETKTMIFIQILNSNCSSFNMSY